MFGFRKSPPPPVKCPANPGVAAEVRATYPGEAGEVAESVDLVAVTADVFARLGRKVRTRKGWVEDLVDGYAILPNLVDFGTLDGGRRGVRSTTTVQVNHPTKVPTGVFEFQHSAGDGLADSVAKGIDQWAQTDYVALSDAARRQPTTCSALNLEFPAAAGRPARARRAVLGPVAHFRLRPDGEPPPPAPPRPPAGSEDGDGEHPFCPCCLLTRSFDAYKELIEADGFFGVRLYAARDQDGRPQADCRVNGEDWPAGAEALREYVRTWPDAGFEFRKQYVVLQDVPAS